MKFINKIIKKHRILALGVLVILLLVASGIYLAITRIQAETPAWEWAKGIGGNEDDLGKAVTRDAVGNVYVAGEFEGTITIPTLTPTVLVSAGDKDIYIVKYDSNGNPIWATSLSGTGDDSVNDIAVFSPGGDDGQIFITGSFVGDLTLTSTNVPAITLVDSDSSGSAFVAKMNSCDVGPCLSIIPNFDWQWANSLDSDGSNVGFGLALDVSSNVYVTGSFAGTATLLDSSNTIIPFSSITSVAGSRDIFVSKFDGTGGDFEWIKTAEGAGDDEGLGIDVDSTGNAYVSGFFTDSATFDPLGTPVTLTNNGGSGGGDAFVAKYDAAGALNWARAYGGDDSAFIDKARGIEVGSDGNVNVAGIFKGDATADYFGDGTLDLTFDPGAGTDGVIFTTSIQNDEKIIIGGDFSSYDGTSRTRIARLNADGSLDTSFDPGAGANSVVYATSIQNDGKIIIGGEFTSYDGTSRNRIARLNTDGSLDTSFNPGTGVSSGVVRTTSIQSDGRIIIAGYFTSYDGTARNKIARLNADGTLDTSFDPGAGTDGVIFTSPIQSDNQIIIGGFFTSYDGTSRAYIARLNTDGSLDTSFNPGTGHIVTTSSIQSDNQIIIGGYFTSYDGTARNKIARLNADGSLDTSFDPGMGASNHVFTTSIQNDGKIIIGGNFTLYDGTSRNRIARLNTDGSLDTSFNPGAGANLVVYTTSIQNDGKIIIGGGFTEYNSVERNYIARLNVNSNIPNLGLEAESDADIFVMKLDPTNGNIISPWPRRAGNNATVVPSLTLDADDNVYVAGDYDGTATFDGTGDTVDSAGDGDALVFGYEPSGAFLWAQSAGGASIDFINDIVYDAIDDAWYVTGSFESTFAIFGTATGSPLTITLCPSISNCPDGFLAKLKAVPLPPSTPPSFSKNFSPNSITTNGTWTPVLTFTIDNTAVGSGDLIDLAFDDTLPVGMTIATPNGAIDGCSGILNADPGSSSILYTAGEVTAGSSCSISVTVTGSSTGTFNNSSSPLTYTDNVVNAGSSEPATATLTVSPVTSGDCSGPNCDGACGPATTGGPYASAPTTNLCAINTVTPVIVTGPNGPAPGTWNWTCMGTNTNVKCSAMATITSPILDACPNIPGNQPTVPFTIGNSQYTLYNGNCITGCTPTTIQTCTSSPNICGTTVLGVQSCGPAASDPNFLNPPSTNSLWVWNNPALPALGCPVSAPAVPPNVVLDPLTGQCVTLTPPLVCVSPSFPYPLPLTPQSTCITLDPPCVDTDGCTCTNTCITPPPPQPQCTPPQVEFPTGSGQCIDLSPPDVSTPPPGDGIEPPGGVLGILNSILPSGLVTQITNVFNTPAGGAATQILATLGLVAGAVSAAASAMFIAPLALLDLPLLPARLWSLFLSFLGVKRQDRWGIAFNSMTQEGIDPTYVVLQDAQGKEVATGITDLEGHYGFAVNTPGIYTLVANKGGYTFPSTKLAGRTSTSLFKNLYFGGQIVIKEPGQIVTQNIPLDPLKSDWNQMQKNRLGYMKSHIARQKLIARISSFFFGLGFIVATVALLFAPQPYNTIIFGLYVLLFVLRNTRILKAKKKGSIKRADGTPLSNAILRVYLASVPDVEIAHSVADKFGSFYRLIPRGKYIVKIDEMVGVGAYNSVFTSLPFKVTKGLIDGEFIIP